MTNKRNDKSWQNDFLNIKSHSPADAKLLMGGVEGLNDAYVKVFYTLNTKN